jgi:hypothetical protein
VVGVAYNEVGRVGVELAENKDKLDKIEKNK